MPSTRQLFLPGIDPTALGAVTAADLLQMIIAMVPVGDIGYVIRATTAPDTGEYPELAQFIWIDDDFVPWFHDGSAWTRLTAKALIEDSSLVVEKLATTGGAPLQVMAVNAAGDAVEFISLAELVAMVSMDPEEMINGTTGQYLRAGAENPEWHALDPEDMADASINSDKLADSGVTAGTYGGADKRLEISITNKGLIADVTEYTDAAPDPTMQTAQLRIANNNLVDADLTSEAWRVDLLTYPPGFAGNYVAFCEKRNDETDGSAYIINFELGTGDGDYLHRISVVVAPPGATGLTFTVRAKQFSGSDNKMRIFIAPVSLASAVESKVTLTDEYVDYVVTNPAVTPGARYFVCIQCYQNSGTDPIGGPNRFWVQSAAVTPIGGSGVFAAAFKRVMPDGMPGASRCAATDYDRVLLSETLAAVRFTTDATAMAVEYEATNYDVLAPTMGRVAVVVNDATTNSTMITASATALAVAAVTLPAGTKTVEVVNGIASADGTASMVRAFYLPLAAVFTLQSPNMLVTFFGDSTMTGYGATNPLYESVGAALRMELAGKVAVVADAGLALNDVADSEAHIAEVVTRITAPGAHVYWVAIGTNDYANSEQDVPAFKTQYGNLIDAIKLRDPQAIVYCQSPLYRDDETANSFGKTLHDYRIAINELTRGRGWARFVPGGDIMGSGYFDDGVHPNTTGYGAYLAYVKTILGLS